MAVNVPNLLLWTVACCVRQRERLLGGQFSGNEGTRRAMCDALKTLPCGPGLGPTPTTAVAVHIEVNQSVIGSFGDV